MRNQSMKIILQTLIFLIISGCASSGISESSPNHFIWYVDEFWEEGNRASYEQVTFFADRHCQKYNKRAIYPLEKKNSKLFKYLEYECIPKEQFICFYQNFVDCGSSGIGQNKPTIQQIDLKRLSDAEDKCLNLGFARNTDKFGECVLQLSK